MTEPIEKNVLVSISYEEAPAAYHNEELGMSIAPEDAAPLTESPETALQTPDSYQSRLATLDLDTPVALHQEGAPSTLQLRSLIVEAGRGTGWAAVELENFLTLSLGITNPDELNVCFDSCEANVADILVQLKHGDEVQRHEAAKSLLGIILGEPRDGGENLADLKRGLLVAAGQISKQTKCDTFYKEVAQLDTKQQKDLWVLSHDSRLKPDPQLLLTLKESQNKTPQTKQTAQEENLEIAQPSPVLGGGTSTVAVAPEANSSTAAAPVAAASTKALAWPNGGLTLIQQILLESLPRTPEQQRYLQASGTPALSQRLAEIVQHPSLTPSQISQGLYYAILARGFSHPEVTSASRQYGELRPVAAQIAGAIVARLGLAPEAKTYLRGDYSALRAEEKKLRGDLNESVAITPDRSAPLSAGRSPLNTTAQSLGLFATPESASLPAAPGTIATSSTVAAGMMGIPFFSLVAGIQQTQVGSRSDSRPGYYIEGTTTAQGESHGGTGGQSSQGQQQDRRQSQADQVVVS